MAQEEQKENAKKQQTKPDKKQTLYIHILTLYLIFPFKRRKTGQKQPALLFGSITYSRMEKTMPQSNQQRALLKNKLQMPMIVRDLLTTEKTPDDTQTYAMHHLFSEFTTENSLLCAAFVMQEIAQQGNVHPSDMAFFHMECERLIECYSARDQLAQENPDLWDETQISKLDDIAEDLESFLDLVALCKLSYEITAPNVTHIIDILDTQLQGQLMIIDEVITMRNGQMLEQINYASTLPTTSIKSCGDNIIVFPGNRQH